MVGWGRHGGWGESRIVSESLTRDTGSRVHCALQPQDERAARGSVTPGCDWVLAVTEKQKIK